MAAQAAARIESWQASHFVLPDATGKLYDSRRLMGEKGSLVMFICNHCPYVVGIMSKLIVTIQNLQQAGIGVVAINANDWRQYPADSPQKMVAFAQQYGFTFPYLVDETQAVARRWGAVCTPDFFGLNAGGELHYRGRFDDSQFAAPDAKKLDVKPELAQAMLMIAATGQGPKMQKPSIGCSIKWRH